MSKKLHPPESSRWTQPIKHSVQSKGLSTAAASSIVSQTQFPAGFWLLALCSKQANVVISLPW